MPEWGGPLLNGLFAGEPEVSKQVWIVGEIAQSCALVDYLTMSKPLIQQLPP
jgi:hypothetical protein